jgi:hypothetical protein
MGEGQRPQKQQGGGAKRCKPTTPEENLFHDTHRLGYQYKVTMPCSAINLVRGAKLETITKLGVQNNRKNQIQNDCLLDITASEQEEDESQD